MGGAKRPCCTCFAFFVLFVFFFVSAAWHGTTYLVADPTVFSHANYSHYATGDDVPDIPNYVLWRKVDDWYLWMGVGILGLINFLFLHTVVFQVFIRVASSAEVIPVLVFQLIKEGVELYNEYVLLGITETYTHFHFLALILIAFLELVSYLLVAAADAWTGSRRMKIGLLLIPIALESFIYCDIRFESSRWFIAKEYCYWYECTTLRSVAMGANANAILFYINIWLRYVRGYDNAVWGARYISSHRQSLQSHLYSSSSRLECAQQDVTEAASPEISNGLISSDENAIQVVRM